MKSIPFFFFLLLPAYLLIGVELNPSETEGLSQDQIKNLKEQQETYGEIPEREVEYYRETAPQKNDQDPNFYLEDHSLQEDPIPDTMVK